MTHKFVKSMLGNMAVGHQKWGEQGFCIRDVGGASTAVRTRR